MRSNHNWADLTGKKSVESQVKEEKEEEVKMNDENKNKNKNTGKTMARKASEMEWTSSILAIGSYPTAKDINHCQGFGFHCVNEPVSKFWIIGIHLSRFEFIATEGHYG